MHVSPRMRYIWAATLSVLAIAGTFSSMHAQAGIGAKYGARDPRTCEPEKSATLTLESAKKLFTCGIEVETGAYLYLVTDLNMEMGAPRKNNPATDTYPSIDPNAPVYPIRGSYMRYQCSHEFNMDPAHTNVGKNCNAYPQPRSEGICYRTTFGDWNCKMFDRVTDPSTAKMHVPPPKQ